MRELLAAERDSMTEWDTMDSMLVRLRDRGANPLEAIKVVETMFDLRYPAGKIALSQSPAWADYARGTERMHDAAEAADRELGDE